MNILLVIKKIQSMNHFCIDTKAPDMQLHDVAKYLISLVLTCLGSLLRAHEFHCLFLPESIDMKIVHQEFLPTDFN